MCFRSPLPCKFKKLIRSRLCLPPAPRCPFVSPPFPQSVACATPVGTSPSSEPLRLVGPSEYPQTANKRYFDNIPDLLSQQHDRALPCYICPVAVLSLRVSELCLSNAAPSLRLARRGSPTAWRHSSRCLRSIGWGFRGVRRDQKGRPRGRKSQPTRERRNLMALLGRKFVDEIRSQAQTPLADHA